VLIVDQINLNYVRNSSWDFVVSFFIYQLELESEMHFLILIAA